mmetsp:Transcript_7737/g.11706  ORF Transcript_7737/g.11706 Transcript_7737/m.11706 type:complete len:228 (+) Transcript_7737:126-809(+)
MKWPEFILDVLNRFLDAGSSVALTKTASWFNSLAKLQCERLWPNVAKNKMYGKILRIANAHNLAHTSIICQEDGFFLEQLDSFAQRLWTRPAVIRRWCKSKNIIIKSKSIPMKKKSTQSKQCLHDSIVSFIQWKTCHQCYSLKTAIIATDLLIECHNCSARHRHDNVPPDTFLRWLKRTDWDNINILPADWGIVWHSDVSDDATKARAQQASSLIRNLKSIAATART